MLCWNSSVSPASFTSKQAVIIPKLFGTVIAPMKILLKRPVRSRCYPSIMHDPEKENPRMQHVMHLRPGLSDVID